MNLEAPDSNLVLPPLMTIEEDVNPNKGVIPIIVAIFSSHSCTWPTTIQLKSKETLQEQALGYEQF